MVVDAFGSESGDTLMIDGESYQPSASCLWNYGPGIPIELISPFPSPPHIFFD